MPRKAYTLNEFLDIYRLSRSTFYRLMKYGDGPPTMRVRRKVLIPVDGAEEWAKQQIVKAA